MHNLKDVIIYTEYQHGRTFYSINEHHYVCDISEFISDFDLGIAIQNMVLGYFDCCFQNPFEPDNGPLFKEL
ncbi:MAG: hypothetical protein ACTSW7_00565 [Candidatus Thorarchaeota archaeon]|nr:MAG: hypothetical protein DRP42_02830 [Mycoplasmatota bacterium]HEC72605.1 hypothetical protein [Thermoplasmatales archaeon]